MPQQIGQRELLVQALSGVAQVFLDELVQIQSLIQFANQNQAPVGSNSRSLEIDLQGRIKRELKGLVLFSPIGCTPLRRLHCAHYPHKYR